MIVRDVFRCLLRLHPRGFRDEYAEEMLWVFDEEARRGTPYWLLWDGARSLVRRRLLRHEPSPRRVVAGPGLLTLEGSGLGPGRLLAGLAATTLLFGLVFGAIVEAGNVSGRLRVLTIYTFQDAARPKATTIKTESPAGAPAAAPPSAAERALDSKASSEGGDPTVYRLHETEADRREQAMRALTLLNGPELDAPASDSSNVFVPPDASFLSAPGSTQRPRPGVGPLSLWHYSEYFGILPILGALDTNADLEISRSEMAESPRALQSLDSDGNGTVDARECGFRLGDASGHFARAFVARAKTGFMTFHGVHRVLDANSSETIESEEIENAPTKLLELDVNGDGRLDGEELLPEPVENQVVRIMRLDHDRDGRISVTERGTRLRDFLKEADRDRNLFVTADEVRKEVHRRSDKDGDGTANREEVLRALKSGAFK